MRDFDTRRNLEKDPGGFSTIRASVDPNQRRWQRRSGGFIHFSTISFGVTRSGWIELLSGRGHEIGKNAGALLHFSDFKPTIGVTTRIIVIPTEICVDEDMSYSTEKIKIKADLLSGIQPSIEAACITRLMFTDEDLRAMCLARMIFMHQPIDELLLGLNRSENDVEKGIRPWLSAYKSRPWWQKGDGLAFALPDT